MSRKENKTHDARCFSARRTVSQNEAKVGVGVSIYYIRMREGVRPHTYIITVANRSIPPHQLFGKESWCGGILSSVCTMSIYSKAPETESFTLVRRTICDEDSRNTTTEKFCPRKAAGLLSCATMRRTRKILMRGNGKRRSSGMVARWRNSKGVSLQVYRNNIGVGVRLIKIAAGFIRGGNWNNGANDGAFTLNLNNAPSNSNTNIGFRCSRYASHISRPEQKLHGVTSEPQKHTDALLLAGRCLRENIGPEDVPALSMRGHPVPSSHGAAFRTCGEGVGPA